MNKFYLLFGLLITTCFFSSGCSTKGSDVPAWIHGTSADYPSERYLLGRGAAATAEEAQNRARGDLATIFEVRIKVANENNLSVTQSNNKEQVSKQSRQQVSAKTDKTISGITIAEVWRDPQTMDFHALAILSRADAAANLRDELAKADADIKLHLASAQTAKDPLLKIAALNRALVSSQNRAALERTLKVINPGASEIEAPVAPALIEADLNATLQQMLISADAVETSGLQEFPRLLKGALAAAGFMAVAPAQADFVLVGKLQREPLAPRDGWHWMRATIEVSLVEKATGRVRGSTIWQVKASAQDSKTLDSRLLMEIDKQLKAELRSAIFGFAST